MARCYRPAIDHQVRGTVAFTPDTTLFAPDSWVLSTRPAYNGTILLSNGTAVQALRRQRPHLVFKSDPSAEVDGAGNAAAAWPRRKATHLTNCVDLDYESNNAGWGNAFTMFQPLAQ